MKELFGVEVDHKTSIKRGGNMMTLGRTQLRFSAANQWLRNARRQNITCANRGVFWFALPNENHAVCRRLAGEMSCKRKNKVVSRKKTQWNLDFIGILENNGYCSGAGLSCNDRLHH